jgi:hypothetical protein
MILDCPVCGIGAIIDKPATPEGLALLLDQRRAALVNHYVVDHEVGGERAYDDWPAQRETIIRWAAL